MYFDATGKYIIKRDMLNNSPLTNYDSMKKPNRMCKGTCLQFKASKPVTGGRYEAGQYRCQTCEIYLTERGTDGRSCNCCNMRVRSKPRNRFYKEKFHDKIRSDKVRNAKDSWINENGDVESPKENKIHDLEEEKSTYIYEEIDESVKTYYEFKDFLKTIKLQANYQLVMLKELLEYGELHKGEISESLAYFNNKNTTDLDAVKYYFNVPVYDILLKHEFVIEDEGFLDIPYYSLNVQLERFQKIELIDYLTNEILKYNQEHDIPENEFPNSDNRGNFLWKNSIIKDKSSVDKIKNFVKKIAPNSTNSSWIWSVTPENWEIVKSKNVWGSRVTKEKISKVVKSGDQVAFYVIGSNSFKGIYEFVGDWHDSTGVTWDEDLEPTGELRYKSQIEIKPICLGNTFLSELHEKMELFQGKSTHIRNLVLQGGNGYPSNNQTSLTVKDFKIIKDYLIRNPLTVEPVEEQLDSQNVKECPKCHTRVEDSSDIVFEQLVEEFFGYRQFDPNDPRSKKPQSYCRKCRSHQHTSQTISDFGDKIKNEITPTVQHTCSKCNETKVEGVSGTELDEKIAEHFGFKFSYLVNSPDSKRPNTICRKCSRKTGQEYRAKIRHEISDQIKDTSTSSLDTVDTRIFDFNGDTLNIKNYKILSTNTIQKNQILTNDDVIFTFKVGNMGGIRYTRENDVIVLLSTYSNDYDDSIDTDSGLIIYTGEGKGNQEMKNGNEKILNSQNTPMVFFKEVYQEPGARPRGALDNKYKFVGTVKYQKHYWKEEKGRQVVKFVLEIQS